MTSSSSSRQLLLHDPPHDEHSLVGIFFLSSLVFNPVILLALASAASYHPTGVCRSATIADNAELQAPAMAPLPKIYETKLVPDVIN
ncbi:hypothetical protein BDA96_09G244100 [Sorghum bicolor]|uniref:Uncharacterized protein n=1 Tax=Sorghum bicolor TaxID=4558 RepID=A0A921QEF7_SORBI|nr:hypothetical protein BDA96_09G244100 [Sorghum bicolor]